LRDLIIHVHPDVVGVPWPKQGIAGYGVGPKKMSEQFGFLSLTAGLLVLGVGLLSSL